MLLCELTLPSGTRRSSNQDFDDVYQWFGEIASFGPIRYSSSSPHGGYWRPTFGMVDFLLSAFEDSGDWPPPDSFELTAKHTVSDEASAVTLFDGIAYYESVGQVFIKYSLRGQEFDDEVGPNEAYNDTLDNIFTDACTTLGLTLNTDYSRSAYSGESSPDVVYTTGSSKTKLLDELHNMAKFFAHGFTIIGATLYLFDLLQNRGSSTITEYDIEPTDYSQPARYKLFTADDRTLTGSHPSGKEYMVSPVCHNVNGNIDAALADIKTVMEQKQIVLKVPMEGTYYDINEEITLVDESLIDTITSVANVDSIIYKIADDGEDMVIEARGAMS